MEEVVSEGVMEEVKTLSIAELNTQTNLNIQTRLSRLPKRRTDLNDNSHQSGNVVRRTHTASA